MRTTSSASVKVFYPPYSRTGLVALLCERLRVLATRLPLKQVWLFGSWTRGKATAFSDIDLLVIYADPPREDAYKLVWHAVQVRGLEPHIYSEGQAQPLKATLERMVQDGIVLFPPPDREPVL